VDDDKIPKTRPEKYFYVVHAELNAILHAERALTDCTLYVTTFPCAECMKAVIQTGINKVVYLNELSGDDWEVSRAATMKLADLAAVEIKRFCDKNEVIDYLISKVKFRK
jgi:dCMP deaminase